MKPFKYRKAVQALNLFARKEGGTINKMKALKLAWLADRLHLRNYGMLIFNDSYFAMEYGPVASSIKDLAENTSMLAEVEKKYRSRYLRNENNLTVSSIEDVDSRVLSKAEYQTFVLIYEHFEGVDQWDLSDFTHNYPEWKKHEEKLKHDEYSRVQMDYIDFFEDPSNKELNHQIFSSNDREILELSKSMYLKSQIIEKLVE